MSDHLEPYANARFIEHMTVDEFVESGLAAMINMLVLWPRGVSFRWTVRDDGSIIDGSMCIVKTIPSQGAISAIGDSDDAPRRAQSLLDWDNRRLEDFEAER